ncbi:MULTISPECIES: hypothetical protein [Alteribacter]|uniref:Uncharacterized protein n=1 Tax=Alteribacter keqinensis TaxID=2483800 RepID=A0A3M7TU01_9BACI|nr:MULTISPECIES: hypothetical protein [Alteribacter]MBM7094690.1 hypothetical protein [Alteribacter salitolerans]RNA69110.1 hypothetical protein EBO34_03925 [Alteribacter keqinensis]
MSNKGKNPKQNGKKSYTEDLGPLSPQQLAVILAMLTNVLRVKAVLITVDQTVEVVLQGNLKQQKKEIQNMLNELSEDKVDEWMRMLQKFNSD